MRVKKVFEIVKTFRISIKILPQFIKNLSTEKEENLFLNFLRSLIICIEGISIIRNQVQSMKYFKFLSKACQ